MNNQYKRLMKQFIENDLNNIIAIKTDSIWFSKAPKNIDKNIFRIE